MDEVLLGELHEEIGVKLDVKFEVSRRGLRRLNVQIERRVEKANGLHLVAFEAPFKLSFEEGVL